jgi:hypothetical protein
MTYLTSANRNRFSFEDRELCPKPRFLDILKIIISAKRSSRRRAIMRKARFSEEQITYALKQVESGRRDGS